MTAKTNLARFAGTASDVEPMAIEGSVTITRINGVIYTGPDAVGLHRAMTLRSFIQRDQSCGMLPTPGAGITKMLAQATLITGKRYKRGGHKAAITDLTTWIDEMTAGMPIEIRG